MEEPREVTARVIDGSQVNKKVRAELEGIKAILGDHLRYEEMDNGDILLYSLDPETEERMNALFQFFREQKFNVRTAKDS